MNYNCPPYTFLFTLLAPFIKLCTRSQAVELVSKTRPSSAFTPSLSEPHPAGHVRPRMALNAVQHNQ